mgnify:CR=1 FL=1
MRLTTRVRYGLRLLVQIAEESEAGPVLARRLSEKQGISPAYVDQILIPLRKSGLIGSQRGRKGGYFLAKPAQAITVLDVLETIDGSLNLVDCVAAPDTCSRSGFCGTRAVWQNLTEQVRRTLGRQTLSSLCATAKPTGLAAEFPPPAPGSLTGI